MSPRLVNITELRFYKPGDVPEGAKVVGHSERDLYYELFHATKEELGFCPGFPEAWWNEFGPDEGRTIAARVEVE